jgi:parallel beta-helix repeat protein
MVNGVISQCTIGPSNYSQHGGGAYLLGDVTLSNSTVIANRGFNWGSGVYVSSRCRVESCSIVSNTTASATGQGLLLDLNTGSDFRFRDCRIFGNAVLGLQAYELGYYTAVAATNGTIEHCEIEGNGAGIYLYAASNILVESCRLVKNTGSGILVTGGNNITFRSCEVSRNEQTTASSGIRAAGVYGTGIRMENCTVVANYSIAHPAISSTNSGGVLLTSSEMVNCIVVSNKIGNPASPGLRRSDIILLDNATASYSCSTDLVHGVNGCITNSPQFVVWPVGSGTSATTGNLHLAKGSPCINTGTNTAWMYASFDLDGNRRLRGSHVDMGAYEYPVNGTLFFLR